MHYLLDLTGAVIRAPEWCSLSRHRDGWRHRNRWEDRYLIADAVHPFPDVVDGALRAVDW